MTIFYSHQTGRSSNASSWQMFAKRLRVLARRAIDQTSVAFNAIHQAIITAKMRRLQRELTLHAGSRDARSFRPHAHENHDLDKDGVKFPQRPLILGDKWDF